METLWQDVRYALRTLIRTPGITIFAVLTLAIGIGANTAIFSMVNAVLLRPMALREPERVLTIWEGRGDSDKLPISIPDFLDFQKRNRSFAQMAALANWNANLSGEETPERVTGMQASGDFFESIGAQAAFRRVLSPADAQPGSPRTVVLSHGFWSRHYLSGNGRFQYRRPRLGRESVSGGPLPYDDDGYFRTLGIPLVSGREFAESDTEQGAPVAIINQTFAKRYWPDANLLGVHVQMDDTQQGMRDVEIVGVVGDVHDFGLETDARSEIFAPIPQVPAETISYLKNNMCWFVRTENEPLMVAAPFQMEVKRIDPDVPASSVRTVEQYLAHSLAPRRFNLMLVAVFGAAALLLAAMGIYAVISHTVAQRTREIGIRMAMGAQRGEVLRLILGDGLQLVAGGAALGWVMALLVTRLMKGLLFGVSAADPATYLAITALLFVIAMLACYLPGRRAMSVDPLLALWHE